MGRINPITSPVKQIKAKQSRNSCCFLLWRTCYKEIVRSNSNRCETPAILEKQKVDIYKRVVGWTLHTDLEVDELHETCVAWHIQGVGGRQRA